MKTFLSILIILTTVSFLAAQQPDLNALSNSAGGKRVIAYFAAFNSSDEAKLREFFTENISAESLKQRPVEPRLEFHRQLRSDLQTAEIQRVVSISETEVKILAQAKTGNWVSYTFSFESQPPQKIAGFRIEPAQPPSDIQKANYKAPASKAEFLSTVEKYLDDEFKADNFSGVVLIAEKDKPVFAKSYGLANKEANVSNNIDTKFNLGSINKTFTQVAIGQLVAQGKISFDDKLGKYLPDYPNKDARENVTIGHLFNMKSGIGDFFGEKFVATPKTTFRKNSDFIPLFADAPLAFEPGTKEQYSNGGYILLGAIIEKVTGQSYYDYVRENIFKPAGMTNTDSYEIDKLPSNTAQGYTKRNPQNNFLNNAEMQPAKGSAAGGGYSTAGDLLKYSLAFQNGRFTLLDEKGQPRTEKRMGIAGGSPGVNTLLLANGQTGYTIIVLSNYDPPSAERVGTQIRDWLKDLQQ